LGETSVPSSRTKHSRTTALPKRIIKKRDASENSPKVEEVKTEGKKATAAVDLYRKHFNLGTKENTKEVARGKTKGAQKNVGGGPSSVKPSKGRARICKL